MYKTVCHVDVSPCDMKIIMYQGGQKYAIRGKNKVFYGTWESGIENSDMVKQAVDYIKMLPENDNK